MKLCALLSLLCAPAFAGRTARFMVGARVVRSAQVVARSIDGRAAVEQRGAPAWQTQVESVGAGFRVTILF